MPLPLFSTDWENQHTYNVWIEQFTVFEAQKSIFTFKLSPNGIKGPKGCT